MQLEATAVALPIEGARTRLVPFERQHADCPAYREWLRDPEVVRTLNLPRYLERPVSDAEITEYCNDLMASKTDLFFALIDKSDDRFVGTLKAGRIDQFAGTADIGIMIGDRERWGRGLASDAIGALARHLFETMRLRKLTAGSMADNPAMIAAFEKLGFRQEGCFRRQDRVGDQYVDHLYFGCFAEELRSASADPGGARNNSRDNG